MNNNLIKNKRGRPKLNNINIIQTIKYIRKSSYKTPSLSNVKVGSIIVDVNN